MAAVARRTKKSESSPVQCEALDCPNLAKIRYVRCKTASFCSLQCIKATWMVGEDQYNEVVMKGIGASKQNNQAENEISSFGSSFFPTGNWLFNVPPQSMGMTGNTKEVAAAMAAATAGTVTSVIPGTGVGSSVSVNANDAEEEVLATSCRRPTQAAVTDAVVAAETLVHAATYAAAGSAATTIVKGRGAKKRDRSSSASGNGVDPLTQTADVEDEMVVHIGRGSKKFRGKCTNGTSDDSASAVMGSLTTVPPNPSVLPPSLSVPVNIVAEPAPATSGSNVGSAGQVAPQANRKGTKKAHGSAGAAGAVDNRGTGVNIGAILSGTDHAEVAASEGPSPGVVKEESVFVRTKNREKLSTAAATAAAEVIRAANSAKFKFTEDMDEALSKAVELFGSGGRGSWLKVAAYVGRGATNDQCSQRWNRILAPDNAGRASSRGWTDEQVAELRSQVQQNSQPSRRKDYKTTVDWESVSTALGRTYADCKDKWKNLCKSESFVGMKKGPFTAEEDQLIAQRVAEWETAGKGIGLWAALQKVMDRPDYSIRARWTVLNRPKGAAGTKSVKGAGRATDKGAGKVARENNRKTTNGVSTDGHDKIAAVAAVSLNDTGKPHDDDDDDGGGASQADDNSSTDNDL